MSTCYLGKIFVACIVIALVHASVTNQVHRILNSTSDYYFFKPTVSHCKTCGTGEEAFSTEINGGRHIPEFEFSFTANGTQYHIALELNSGLIPAGFSVSYLGYDWEPAVTYKEESAEEINNCYYHGRVIGVENSQVITSTCHGFKGTIYLPDDVLHFAPIKAGHSMHILYREEEINGFACGNPHNEWFHHSMIESYHTPTRLKREKQQKFIELLFVVNKELYGKFASIEELHEHVKEVVNYVDAHYKRIDLRVVLLHLEVWDKQDQIKAETNAQTVLSDFLSYRTRKVQETASSPWKYTDNAQLLYGGDFDGTTLGMATVSSMCGLRSGGVNMDRGSERAQSAASTITHEMGHNLGMSHDTSGCDCGTGKICVMAAVASLKAPDDWSDCSKKDLERGYKNGVGNCLTNVPDSSKIFGGPKCGNRIIEEGEQCDCGLAAECESQCCNATSCMLYDGADCDSGTCCTADCHYKDSCHICRVTANECDIAEYCTGHSAHCPNNVHKLDGLTCRADAGMCYGGVCRTHEDQCKDMWGDGAVNGDQLCYDVVNLFGNWNGNCGKAGAQYKKCEKKDVRCGKLICMGGEARPLLAANRIAFRTTVTHLGKRFVCKTVQSVNGSSDSGDLAHVRDGTKCGDGKICFDGACVENDSVLKSCNMDCHGHGVCNNFRNCHCDAGWGPPSCRSSGNGGSADSGPICASDVDIQVVLMLVFFLVILPIVLGLFFYIWWRVCGGRQKMYAWRKNRAYRRGQRDPKSNENVASREKAPARAARGNPASSRSSTGDSYFNTLQPASSSYPLESGVGRHHDQAKRPSVPSSFDVSRPPPPNRPSPRFPVRSAPQRPDAPKKPPQPSVGYKPSDVNVGFVEQTNGSNSTSVQARIAQLKQGGSNWS